MIDMKKRIIAALLAVVMTVLCLVSCGSAFSFADEDMTKYTDGTFDINKFFEALKKIEIKDGDFTTDEATGDKKVAENIYDKIASAYITEVGNDYYSADKLKEGDINEGDVVYFCYFAKDADGNYFMLSDMEEASITNSKTKAKHFIKLGNYDEDDAFMAKVAEALLAKEGVKYYSTKTKADLQKGITGSTEKLNAIKVAANDIIVVSYKLEYTEGDTDYKKTASFETIKLDGSTPLSEKLTALISTAGAKVNVGEKVEAPSATYNGDTDKTTTTTFEVVDNGITKKYSDFTINYKIDSYVSEEEAITFTLTYEGDDLYADNLRDQSASKVELKDKDKEFTYYVYPVYRLDVPEVSAETVIEYVYGKNVSGTSNELFTSEEYKYTEGESSKTVKALITSLSNLWKDTYEEGSDIAKLYKDFKDADAAFDEAVGDKVDEAEAKYEKARLDFYTAKRTEIRNAIKKITAAVKGEDKLGEKLFEEYEKDIRHSLKEEYNTYITEEIGKEVWKIIDEQVVVKEYPEQLVKEFSKHLYESYEYEFHNGDAASDSSSANKESNYTKYKGVFKDYLKVTLGVTTEGTDADIDAALAKEAKEHIEPIIKLYLVAQKINAYEFEGGQKITDVIKKYVQADIDAGIYDAHYEYNDSLSKAENEKAEARANEQAKKNKEAALKNAESFLVTDAVFNEYKKDIGKKTYQVWEEQYGEINIRAALQLDKLFYFLVSTDVEMAGEDDHKHQEPVYFDRDGDQKLWIKFRNVVYNFPAEDEGE